jgi:hypothetical protein
MLNFRKVSADSDGSEIRRYMTQDKPEPDPVRAIDAGGKLLESGEKLTQYYTGLGARASWRPDMPAAVAAAIGLANMRQPPRAKRTAADDPTRNLQDLRAVKTQKQVPYGFAHPQREPAAATMLVAVMDHMAALAKRFQVSRPIVGWIMIKVSGRQRDPGCSNDDVISSWSKAPQRAAAPIAPRLAFLVPPSAVAQMPDLTAMRPAAFLAAAFRPLKPDHRRELRPVDGIEPFVLGADRHRVLSLRAKGVERPGRAFRNYAVRNATGGANLMHWLARVAELDRLAPGVLCRRPPVSHLPAPPPCPLATVSGACPDDRCYRRPAAAVDDGHDDVVSASWTPERLLIRRRTAAAMASTSLPGKPPGRLASV